MKKLKYIILLFLCMATSLQMKAVDVTLTTDENVNRPAGIYNAERNLAAVLTEINRAQKDGRVLQEITRPPMGCHSVLL